MKTEFVGPLAALMKQYLELRRSLGYSLLSTEHVLRRVDPFWAEHFPDTETVTRPMILGYLESMKHFSPSTRHLHLSRLRVFCRFLSQYDLNTYIPEKNLEPRGERERTPYIFSEREVVEIIRAARRLPPPNSLRPHTYATMIGLLWATGIRPKEALDLDLQDIDFLSSMLYIRESKFLKSRLVPLAGSTTKALHDYCHLRARFGQDQGPTAPLFINERARRCMQVTVGQVFRGLVRQLGMRTAQGGNPRLYDLRHTFATRTLLEAYQSGKDPGACLPILATYLGHVSVAHTQVYLHPLPELLAITGNRFHEYINLECGISQGGYHEKE